MPPPLTSLHSLTSSSFEGIGAVSQLDATVRGGASAGMETPRLLLLSSCGAFPQGLANSSGLVGRGLLSHPTWQVFGTFDHPINAYKGMQMGHVMVQDGTITNPAGRATDDG